MHFEAKVDVRASREKIEKKPRTWKEGKTRKKRNRTFLATHLHRLERTIAW